MALPFTTLNTNVPPLPSAAEISQDTTPSPRRISAKYVRDPCIPISDNKKIEGPNNFQSQRQNRFVQECRIEMPNDPQEKKENKSLFSWVMQGFWGAS